MIMSKTSNKTTPKEVFRIPDGYFEQLESKVMQRIHEYPAPGAPKCSPMCLTQHRYRVGIAAAVVAAFVTTTGWHKIQQDRGLEQTKHNALLSEQNNDANLDKMIDYVMYDEDDLYAYLMDN